VGLFERLASELAEYLTEAGGCDHNVGICACESENLLYETRLMIARLRNEAWQCPDCGFWQLPLKKDRCDDCEMEQAQREDMKEGRL